MSNEIYLSEVIKMIEPTYRDVLVSATQNPHQRYIFRCISLIHTIHISHKSGTHEVVEARLT